MQLDLRERKGGGFVCIEKSSSGIMLQQMIIMIIIIYQLALRRGSFEQRVFANTDKY